MHATQQQSIMDNNHHQFGHKNARSTVVPHDVETAIAVPVEVETANAVPLGNVIPDAVPTTHHTDARDEYQMCCWACITLVFMCTMYTLMFIGAF